MPKIILRNKATNKIYPMEQSEWEKVKSKYKHIFEEVSVIEIPPEVLRLNKLPYVDGKLQYK